MDLFFGASHGGEKREAWGRFMARVVTPRFPQGFTVLDGAGQWRGPNGLQREPSRLLIIFYRPDATTDGAIEFIRAAYKARFRQQSVLRVDSMACVSF